MQCACAYVMAERRRSAHAIDDQNNGGTLSAKKTRDPLSSYLYRSVRNPLAAVVHYIRAFDCMLENQYMVTTLFCELKGHCIEFKYYADGVYILVLPRRINNS